MSEAVDMDPYDNTSMNQRIAISVFGHRVSSRLDCSETVLLVTIDNGAVIQRHEVRWAHLSALEKVPFLLHEGVSLLICGGLTETSANVLRDSGIHAVSWVRGEVDDVLLQFLQGRLRTNESHQDNKAST